jgi:transcriptional regulator with XRE-family HTH domain
MVFTESSTALSRNSTPTGTNQERDQMPHDRAGAADEPDPSRGHSRARGRADRIAFGQEFLVRLGQRVRDARISLGMQPTDLANKADVNASTIYSLEAANNPTVVTVLRVAQALGVSITTLLSETADQPEASPAKNDDGHRLSMSIGPAGGSEDSLDNQVVDRVAALEKEVAALKAGLASVRKSSRRR